VLAEPYNHLMHIRRRYHLHAPGLLFIGVAILLGFGAVNSQNNLIFIAFGLALGLILASGLVSGSTLMLVKAKRLPVTVGRVGERLLVVYRVRNRSRFFPAMGLVVEEVPEKTKREKRKRSAESARASALMETPRAALLHVPARQVRHVTAYVTPTQRGEVRFAAVRVWTAFPSGVLKKSVTFQQTDSTLIHPQLVDISTSVLEHVFSAQGRSETLSHQLGRDADFYGLREYVPGDSPRQIAWRASARIDELVVRENFATVSADVVIVISFADSDPASSHEPDERDELAISVTASLAKEAHRRGARVVVSIPAVGLRVICQPRFEEAGGSGGDWEIQDALARVDLHGVEDLRQLRPASTERGAVLVIHAQQVDPSVAPGAGAHLSAARVVASDPTSSPQPSLEPVEAA
jgi:uncharacterized protein (DUF58 family)